MSSILLKEKRNMIGRRIMIGILCALMSIQVQAAPLNSSGINRWSHSKKADAFVTREEGRKLLEETIGKPITKSELTARPEDLITREELALMLINILGYEGIAAQMKNAPKPFKDVSRNVGAVIIMKDLKLITGESTSSFNPDKKLKASEVLTIIKRLYDRLGAPISEMHSSYAIRSSDQMTVIQNLTSVSFGWSQVEYDSKTQKISVNTSSKNNNDFNRPLGFEVPLSLARLEQADVYFMVYLNNKPIGTSESGKSVTLAAYIFDSKEIRKQLIDDLLAQADETAENGKINRFDGITIDFENFYDASLKEGFNTFLKELKAELDKKSMKLNVALQPGDYYKGYDYKTIGQIADRVILMAHDYAPKALTDAEMQAGLTVTPVTPIDAVYRALKEITDAESGMNPDKVMLQISFASTQWQVKENRIISRVPFTPSYDKIFKRLQDKGTQIAYSNIYQNPYAIYYEGGVKNVIWYENAQSVTAKIDLAKLFGIHQISLWRLGTIPNYENVSGRDLKLNVMAELALISE